jgi:hypothetical protein
MEDARKITKNPEPRREDQPKRRPRWVRVVLSVALAAVALVPAIAAFAFLVVLPALRIAKAPAAKPAATVEKTAKTEASAGEPGREDSPELLRHDEAFWSARLELAKQPKFALAVDLVDSVASLDFRGVPLRKCKILAIKTSRALPFMFQRPEFRERLSNPLQITSETATLAKEPIRVTFAPKDSIEAEAAAAKPIEPEKVDVYFNLYFDGGLVLAVRQAEEPVVTGFWHGVGTRVKSALGQAKIAARSLYRRRLPQHQLEIEVTLSRDDAKALYRALGFNAKVALRL